MKGDFTRTTFDAAHHFSRVLQQQGRVTLDADANEQTDILLHYMRTLAADLIGPYAAPAVGGGFAIGADENGRLSISAGRYYVDGILVENGDACLYTAQPYFTLPADDPLAREMQDNTGKVFWLYLDVWERHVTFLDVPSIRESALGGPDTCSRAQVVWQVRAASGPDLKEPSAERVRLEKAAQALKEQIEKTTDPAELKKLQDELARVTAQIEKLPPDDSAEFGNLDCSGPLGDLAPISDAGMAARVDPGYESDDPCVLAPQSKYRGLENHFYRVEIHTAGKAGTATFKWSRDNGSVVAAWLGTSGYDLQVSSSRGFSANCWVELIDDDRELLGIPGALARVTRVEGQTLTIEQSSISTTDALAWSESLKHPKVRRWDQVQGGDIVLKNGAVPIVESSATDEQWLDLEDGIQVQFSAGGTYRTGDYWTIPARVPTGRIEWPEDSAHNAVMLTPFGVEHHYAPLGYVRWENKKAQVQSCACTFVPESSCFKTGSRRVTPVGPAPHAVIVRQPGRMQPIAAPRSPSAGQKPGAVGRRKRKGGGQA